MTTIRAITFDLDGTLLDTLDDIADAMNSVLADRQLPQHSVERYKQLVGDGMETLVRRALPADADDEAMVAETMEAMRVAYGRRWDQKTRPYGGIPELLDELVAREIDLLILSNKPEELTVAAVAKLLAPWSFASVRGARAGVPKKPDPTAMLALMKQHQLSAERLLYVGDTNTDMRTARAAGLRAVGVTWGFRSEQELRQSGAHHILHAPRELLELLRIDPEAKGS